MVLLGFMCVVFFTLIRAMSMTAVIVWALLLLECVGGLVCLL